MKNWRIRYTQLSAYADDSTFFLQNIDSVMEPARTFKEFSSFFWFKCEIAGTGSLEGVKQQSAVWKILI